jgi:hypothetical protein
MSKQVEVKWLDVPEEHDYPAALSYLTLIYDDQTAVEYVEKLHAAPMTAFKAKDIFRASGLPLLGISNDRVEHDQEKIKKDIPLSPLLLVRDTNNGKVVIADGYHRLCALYSYEENSLIPCKIV